MKLTNIKDIKAPTYKQLVESFDQLVNEINTLVAEAVIPVDPDLGFEQQLAEIHKRMEAARKGLGLVNRLPAGPSRTAHRSRIMGNLNTIRTMLNRMLKQQAEFDRAEHDHENRTEDDARRYHQNNDEPMYGDRYLSQQRDLGEGTGFVTVSIQFTDGTKAERRTDDISKIDGLTKELSAGKQIQQLWITDEAGNVIDHYDSTVDDMGEDDHDPLLDEPEDHFRDDVEADADTLASVGWGTDEDYGFFGDEDEEKVSEKGMCDICDKRPYTHKTVAYGIETYLCNQCGNRDEEEEESSEEKEYQEHISREGRFSWNQHPDGCYYCGRYNHKSGDCPSLSDDPSRASDYS